MSNIYLIPLTPIRRYVEFKLKTPKNLKDIVFKTSDKYANLDEFYRARDRNNYEYAELVD